MFKGRRGWPSFFLCGALSGVVAPCGCLRSRFVLRRFEGVLRGWRARWGVRGVKACERRVQRVWRWCLGATVVVRCCAVFAVALLWCVAAGGNQSCFHAQLVKVVYNGGS